jgi:hypothetical protein
MKKLYLFPCLLCLQLYCFGQGQSFIHFPDSTYWHLTHLNGNDYPCTSYSKTDVLEYFDGDTVINSINYRIIREKYLGFYYGSCGNKVIYHTAYIREDTTANKVFLFKNEKDTLLYDYTLQVGDTLKGWHANPFSDNFVIQIDTIFLRNKYRRVWYFDVLNNIGIVEGYGTIERGVKASLFFFGVGPYTETRLTCLNDTLGPILYQPFYFNTQCFPYSISENTTNTGLHIYPNPTQTGFTMQIKEYVFTDVSITVRNTLGKICHQQTIASQEHYINTETWAKGVYLIEAFSENILLGRQKLIKQ